MIKYLIAISLFPNVVFANVAEDLRISGFGSATTARSDSTTPVGQNRDLVDEWCFDCDTTLGIQLEWQISPGLRSAVQVIKRPQDHFSDPKLERAFVEYLTNNFKFKLGRLRTPLFIMSEYYYVSGAYPWLHLPNEVYDSSLGVTHYEGIGIDWSYETQRFGQFVLSPYYSRPVEEKIDQFGQRFHIRLTDGFGLAGNWYIEDNQVHAAIVHVDVEQTFANSLRRDLSFNIFSTGFSYTYNNWHLQSELLLTENLHSNWYASADYNWQALTPYVVYGQSRRRRDTESYTLGINYAVAYNISLYAEWQRIEGRPELISGQFTMPQDPSAPFDTDVNVLSFGLSLTF